MNNEDIYIPSDEVLADDDLFAKYCDLMIDEMHEEQEQVLRDPSTYDGLPF